MKRSLGGRPRRMALDDLTTDGMVNSDDLDEFVASFEEMGQP